MRSTRAFVGVIDGMYSMNRARPSRSSVAFVGRERVRSRDDVSFPKSNLRVKRMHE